MELAPHEQNGHAHFATGVREIDGLLGGSVPCGQLIEIAGATATGKTALLSRMIAGLTQQVSVAFCDFSRCLLPSPLFACNLDLERFSVIQTMDRSSGLRAAERFLRGQSPACIVFDLASETKPLPMILLHRLRQQVVRAGALVVFLTEGNSNAISPSTVALRLVVRRINRTRVAVTVERSRICPEGVTAEVDLDA